MNSRRQFVKQGAIAGTFFLAAKPFNTLAGIGSSLGTGDKNHLVLLHTAENEIPLFSKTAGYINNIRSASSGAVFVHSGKKHSDSYSFDVPAAENRGNAEYSIVSGNGIRTGVIFINEGEYDAVNKVNELAALLKKEKNCQLVVCISQLGYKSGYSVDDITLARASNNLDLIIGGHSSNYTKHTRVLYNRSRSEVIIQSSKNNDRNCGKIEFLFDRNGLKKHVHVATKVYKPAATA